MICIAAFIILLIVGIFVAFISIFKPKVGKQYLKTLKKSWSCFGKRVTLQKCETGFGDDVKNNILSKLIIRHPKWVKPVSAAIERYTHSAHVMSNMPKPARSVPKFAASIIILRPKTQ